MNTPCNRPDPLEQEWEKLRLTDRRRLAGLFRDRNHLPQEKRDELIRRMTNAAAHSLCIPAGHIRTEFPEELPITGKINEIRAALTTHQAVIVCGTTGSGKTTQLPKAALMQGLGRAGRIGCTQPRRIAASALARRLSAECGVECGQEIGYKVRFDDHTDRDLTVIKFMTDGILLAETRDDPNLLQYDCIILDEVHERSLNIDFLLGYMKLLLQRRRDLRVIVSSATLESDRISVFFNHAPIVEVEGRMFPVEDVFLEPDEEEELSESIGRGAQFLTELDPRGDILVFLPGEREIRNAAELLEGRRLPNTEILPLYGRLSASEQERIFKPGHRRRIILSTNVAETSLTIPGIRFVIDSGLVRLSRYNPRSRIQELLVEPVSQASVRQRRGRCGRLRDGVCVHLYSKEDLEQADPYTDPEIQRSSLAGVILQMAALKLPSVEQFPFVDPPDGAHIREGLRTLEDLQAIDANRRLTRTGWELAALPLDPHLGRILLAGAAHHAAAEMIVICAFLSIQDPRERPYDHAKAADDAQREYVSDKSDFLGILKLWNAIRAEYEHASSKQALRRYAKKHYLSYRRITEWSNLAADLLDAIKEKANIDSVCFDLEKINPDAIHMSLMCGLPRQLAVWKPEDKQYSDMSGKRFMLFPGSGLSKSKSTPPWILFFALMETSRVFARCNAEVKPEWLEKIAPRLCKYSYDCIAWDEQSGFVYARERVTAGQLIIHPGRRKHYGKIDPVNARTVFIRDGILSGAAYLKGTWLARTSELVRGLHELELRMRRPDSLLDLDAMYAHFDSVLPAEMNSLEDVRRDWQANHRDYTPDEADILQEQFEELHKDDFPDRIYSGGQSFPVRYTFDPGEKEDGLLVTIPEALLNLVDSRLPEYLVPGWLKWKVEHLFRSLPKAARKELTPIGDAVDKFMTEYRAGRIFTGQPCVDAVREFLEEEYALEVDPRALDEVVLPEHLVMRVALVNTKGAVSRVVTELPDTTKTGSRLAPTLNITKKWELSGASDWPGLDIMPEWVELPGQNGRKAYPALTLEEGGKFGRSLFLKEQDARISHSRAVTGIFRARFAGMMKQLKNSIKLPHELELTFFLDAPQDWKDELLDLTLTDALGGELWELRSSGRFENSVERARNTAAGILQEKLQLLERIHAQCKPGEKLLRRLPEDCFTAIDAEEELALLFRPHFLCAAEALERYPRYFKSFTLRLERALTSSPRKDEGKGAQITSLSKKMRLAAESDPHIERNRELYDFFLLLEEARITAFTPEQTVVEKCSPAKLREKWDTLRL